MWCFLLKRGSEGLFTHFTVLHLRYIFLLNNPIADQNRFSLPVTALRALLTKTGKRIKKLQNWQARVSER